jgi:threonine/homoserine/homoserine lactone efflux protein
MTGAALLAGFLLGGLGSVPVAGPTALVVVESTLDNQPKKGLYVAIGAAIAESLYAALAFWGLTALFAKYPAIAPISRLFSGAILILVGLHFAIRGHHSDHSRKLDAPHQRERNFLLGFAITFLNPTLAATWAAAVAALHSVVRLRYSPYDALLFGFGVCAGIITWFWLVIHILCRFRSRVQRTPIDYAVRAVGGVLVIAGALVTARTVMWLK